MRRQGPPQQASFLVTLLRRGAPAIATASSELSDEVADPTPVRALRRISAMAAPVDPRASDGLLLRAGRYVAFVPMVYRLIAVPGALAAYLGTHGGTGVVPVLAVAILSILLNAYGMHWMLRSAPFRSDRAAVLLTVDAVFTALANLVVAALVPPEVFADAIAVPGKHLLGTVALFTLALGLPYGIGLLAGSIPLHLLMSWANTGTFSAERAFAGLGTMAGVLLTASGALVLIGLGTRLALAYGIRNGRQAERARQHRLMHDTVLQTLEALALPGQGTAEEQLAEVRRLARAEAVEVRKYIEAAANEGARPLGEKLASLAAEMARDGLRAQVVIAELDEDTLSEVRQIAIRDAVREAMRNTMKHSGTDKVLVRVEERDGGIAVITRDHGTGFSSDTRPPGFGISESITARLAEVGGKATVESAPGNGTRVTLWVPC
ncbi:sensor histidine kinase [Amycolatopsis magusensis]|uniref:Signal transduction histidine kinase n=1 Tax=Amycolatopsis magusensis TaxID=882444 RepID=A0ABS4PK05_9PSEU|nr:ATP-binding protein [Amycolatopsis magusensis]MBP2179759.1 signal transduction histidine kinase [Amycolatopsis magusensis]